MSNILDNSQPDRESEGTMPGSDRLDVEVEVDQVWTAAVDRVALRDAAVAAARSRGHLKGKIGIRVTDDATIHELNQKFIGHDYPTDVISFGYECRPEWLEGEMVVSAETAATKAAEYGWPDRHELMLYVIHGSLHVTGMDDLQSGPRAEMRQCEQEVMLALGIDQIRQCGADSPPREEPA